MSATGNPAPQQPSRKNLRPGTGGPRTESGKKRSMYNAVRSGIFTNIVLEGEPFRESRAGYLRLLAALREDFRPQGAFEEVLVEKLTFAFLRLSRIYKWDARIAPKLFQKVEEALGKDAPTVATELVNKEVEVAVVQKDPAPDLLLDRENSVDRQIDRILDQIERRRRLRNT